MEGKVKLPPTQVQPKYLKFLYEDKESSEAKEFKDNIRSYNALFAFTSMGGKVDKSVNQGVGPYVYRLYGQNFHWIGTLLPLEGESSQYTQLYIYDISNEVKN